MSKSRTKEKHAFVFKIYRLQINVLMKSPRMPFATKAAFCTFKKKTYQFMFFLVLPSDNLTSSAATAYYW